MYFLKINLARAVDELDVAEAGVLDGVAQVRPGLVGGAAAGGDVEATPLELRLPRRRLRACAVAPQKDIRFPKKKTEKKKDTFEDADGEVGLDAGVAVEHARVGDVAGVAAHVVGEDPVGGGGGVGARQVKVAKVRHVEQGRPRPRRFALGADLIRKKQKQKQKRT